MTQNQPSQGGLDRNKWGQPEKSPNDANRDRPIEENLDSSGQTVDASEDMTDESDISTGRPRVIGTKHDIGHENFGGQGGGSGGSPSNTGRPVGAGVGGKSSEAGSRPMESEDDELEGIE